jgi:hypothetical protein
MTLKRFVKENQNNLTLNVFIFPLFKSCSHRSLIQIKSHGQKLKVQENKGKDIFDEMYEYERRSEGGGRNRSKAPDEKIDNEEAGRGILPSRKAYDSPHQFPTSQLFTTKMQGDLSIYDCSSRARLSSSEEIAMNKISDATFLDTQSVKINDAVVALFKLSLSPKAISTQRLTTARRTVSPEPHIEKNQDPQV